MAGAQCCENSPALSSVSGASVVEEIGGLNAYITGTAEFKAAVLLVSDVFGFEAPNLRIRDMRMPKLWLKHEKVREYLQLVLLVFAGVPRW